MKRPQPIAIVGLGGVFPDAPDLNQFWQNVAQRRCAAREVPEGRWILSKADAFDPQKGAPDKVYSLKACLIDNFRLDPAGIEIDRALLERLDPVFHLALHAARQAFGEARTSHLDRSRVGVVIGNVVLPTEASSALTRELLLPVFEERALGRHLKDHQQKSEPLNRFVAGLPAGLIAKGLGLGGGAYTLDAACASSLYALKLAVEELRAGRADAMITGGVSRPESLYTQMGFSQLRALSASGRPAPFDITADGLVVGEGAGMVVLKRLDEAMAAGDTVYGVIRGIGLSNDVGGSLLAPNTVGQLRAMRQAYQEAGWSPSDVDYVECHATGTPTGDPIEVASLKALWGERGWTAGQCALGSVKSNIGHLLSAAGAAGLIKVLLGFKHKSLPPTANFSKTGPLIDLRESPFAIQKEIAAWNLRNEKSPRRAAISAFGFGGINAHVLIEEFAEKRTSTRRAAKSAAPAASVPVAIVGMEARFGPLSGLREFQEAVLSGRWLDPATPEDRWWGMPGAKGFKGHFLPEAGLRSEGYRIPPKEIEEMLPQQILMLDTAAKAIADARLPEAGRDRMGVFVGIGLDLNTTNFNFRWHLVDKARAWAKAFGWNLGDKEAAQWLETLRRAAGPALSANRTMGALGGIVASRISREFSIGGPSFTLSSEECSGLRALEVGLRALQRGELDCALIGAVDIAGDARAVLSTHAGRPYASDAAAAPFDARSSGASIGEGAAALILKRLDDALRDGDRVYAVIAGVGSASGGTDSYAAALRRAYGEARVDPSRVGYLEAHGSGTPSEDKMEAAALTEFFGTASTGLRCALGTLKSQLGHAGAASGLAGVVKAALAVYQEILPPFQSIDPIPELARGEKRFHIPLKAQYWLRNRAEGPRRAGVSSIGVDGSCAHVVLESFDRSDENPAAVTERRQPLGARAEALLAVEAGSAEGLLAALRSLKAWAAEQGPHANIELLARRWWLKAGSKPLEKLGLALIARDWKELLALASTAEQSIAENPERPIAGDRIHFTYRSPLGADGLTFVFPGSGNQYVGMGLDLGAQWPEVLRQLDIENGYLRQQLVPEHYAPWRLRWESGWQERAESELLQDFKSMIFGSVAHGTVVSDLVRSFGVSPKAVVGYSLGETAGLFALRAWTARDEMLRRMNESSLFVSDLAGPCDAARQFWNLPTDERVDWVLGVIDRPADTVRLALKGMERAALLIVNAPVECVVGGYRQAVNNLVEGMGCVFLPLQGVSTVHFPAAKLVERKYRDLHLHPTQAPAGVRFYSGVLGTAYEVTRESAADSITAQAVKGFDYSALIKQAYEDGCRVFVELGPQASCTRMIGKILGPLPHAAKSACGKGQDPVSGVLKLLAMLIAERVPVDLKVLYGQPSLAVEHREVPRPEPNVRGTLGGKPFERIEWRPKEIIPERPKASEPVFQPSILVSPITARPAVSAFAPAPAAGAARPAHAGLAVFDPARAVSTNLLNVDAARSKAHETFLRISQNFAAFQSKNLAFQNWLLQQAGAAGSLPAQAIPKKVFMDREACLEFAVGKISKVLGEAFSHVDAHPTRVRLPDEPLMLVDRILSVHGEPNSMKSGRVVTEHDVLPGAWYLDSGVIPTCIAVEAGQADLFLSGYLGIDSQTKGLAVYRLLDAQINFHQGLPGPGEVIHYDIRINNFAKHGEIWLFFFDYDCTVNGRPLLTMRKGCAGFFTQKELAAGKGIVLTEEESKPVAGKKPDDWEELAPRHEVESYDDGQLDALRKGQLPGCFGAEFIGLKVKDPVTLPTGRMKLVDRILELDPKGGRYGLGRIKGEADIHPDDWHLLCHFSDDNVMPGTLMFECCLHTLRVFLLRMGWVGGKGETWYEPVPGVTSQLKCRGQVLASTKKVVYEISVKELGYGPEPFAIADALMYADGKPIVLISDMSIRMGGVTREGLRRLWKKTEEPKKKVLFDTDKITAFAIGKPSEAFGEPYKIFDSERVIARLPGPPYQFLDRIVDIQNCAPFKLAPGGEIVAEYDVPPDEWYFESNGQPTMPFAVLLEVGLQPCGWLASYVGSALTSPIDLSYRNLGGTATQFIDVGPDMGTLTTRVRLTKVSQSGGMIIQNNDFEISSAKGLVYKGRTEFGYFTKEALGQQLGVRGAKPYEPSAPGRMIDPAKISGMPDEKLLMLDSVEFIENGGPARLGFLRGLRKVDPKEWFFKAHFYQDPVCPGSLGLESFVQLLKVYARQRWGQLCSNTVVFESMALGQEHSWTYRGQYTPVNKQVEISAVITSVDDEQKFLRADGSLKADGLTIYQMKDFALRIS
jgi:acyl transferase domain-containing protein/3-hydroxymyristoyl/3-hydroxydecanoyl-(acyl carrier protein) dehydratase